MANKQYPPTGKKTIMKGKGAKPKHPKTSKAYNRPEVKGQQPVGYPIGLGGSGKTRRLEDM